MFDRNYARGYLKMFVKCAQFTTHNPAEDRMYYAISSDAQERLDRRMGNIDAAQKKYDELNGWNPLNWAAMASAKYQEGHNKRELEREKKRIASDMAANSTPVDYWQMRNLSRYNGSRFLGVDNANSGSYESTRDSLANGFNDYGVLRDITSGARAGRLMYDNSQAGRQAAIRRQNEAKLRRAFESNGLIGFMAEHQRQQIPIMTVGTGQFAAQQRGYAR